MAAAGDGFVTDGGVHVDPVLCHASKADAERPFAGAVGVVVGEDGGRRACEAEGVGRGLDGCAAADEVHQLLAHSHGSVQPHVVSHDDGLVQGWAVL